MSKFVLPKSLIIIDVETTGTDIEHSSIIQLGACILHKEGYLESYTFNEYILPYLPTWTKEAQKVHGISYTKIQEIGKPIKEVLEDFENWLARFCIEDIQSHFWLAQWGANFDVPLLKKAYESAERRFPFYYRTFDLASIIRFELAKQGKLYQECGEDKCALALGIKVDKTKLHDALYDVQLSGKMLEKIIKEENNGYK